MNGNESIYFFRHTPFDVDIRMYEYFAHSCRKGRVNVYAETSFKSERTVCGYRESADGINTVILDQTNISIDDAFFEKNKSAIFIFYGFQFANRYKASLLKHKIAFGIISERDISFCQKSPKVLLRKIFPVTTYLQHRDICDNVRCFLAMGKSGMDSFHRHYGVRKSVLFDYMYNDGNDAIPPKPKKKNEPVRFVYVGRFDYHIKGVDTMLDAFDKIESGYQLDLIGGYGGDCADISERVKNNPRIRICGVCDRNKLCGLLNEDYDVIVVPSRQDGWNLHCNLAVNAGIGAIATDQTVSHELIEACGNGIVTKAGDVKALQNAIESVIKDPDILTEWKAAAAAYAEKISYTAVAEYLQAVLEYSFTDTGRSRPECPWLVSGQIKAHISPEKG